MKRASNKKFTSNKENRMNLKKMFSLTLALVIALTTTACGGGGGGGNNNGTSDTSKPTVTITAPANGATVGGAAVVLSATASDTGSGVNHVDFKVDGNTVCSATGNTYSCTWNSTGVTNDSSHTFTAVAYDVAGNVSDPSSSTATVHNTVLPGTWRSVASPTTKNLKGIWAAAPDNVYAVGEAGTIIRWNGSSWSTVTPITSANLNAIWGSNPNNIWVAGDTGTILHWDGMTWSMAASSTSRNLTSVWGSDASNVLMTGGGGAGAGSIIWWAGSYWSVVPYVYDSFLSMTGFNQTDVWAVGYGGIIRHWSGVAWVSSASGTTRALYSVWGSSSNNIWVVGDAGTILNWNGSNWSAVASGVDFSILSVNGSGPNDVWFLVGGGTMLHWDGVSLSVARSASTDYLWTILSISSTDAWSVGDGGKILHYSP
jgi:hypothetical protein